MLISSGAPIVFFHRRLLDIDGVADRRDLAIRARLAVAAPDDVVNALLVFFEVESGEKTTMRNKTWLTSGDTLNKIASALGIGQEQAGKAVSAAVPTLLAALAGAVSRPAGGANLANVLAKQNAGELDNLSSLFSGGGAAAASQGSNLLGSLLGGLGGGALGQIGSVLSRFTGVNFPRRCPTLAACLETHQGPPPRRPGLRPLRHVGPPGRPRPQVRRS